jgi:hypothetical protein
LESLGSWTVSSMAVGMDFLVSSILDAFGGGTAHSGARSVLLGPSN